jgi:Ca2+-binding RTX toxin-like protein
VCDKGATPECDEADVSIAIAAVNDAPVAVDDADTVEEDGSARVNVLDNDTDAEDNIAPSTVRLLTDPQDGTATANTDGTITYAPNANFNGADSFTYRVCDTDGDCDTAEVTMTVTPVDDPNQAPVAVDDAETVEEDTSKDIDVLLNDTDADADGNGGLDPTSVRITVAPTKGTAIPNNDGTVTYTPDENATGADSFTYRVCDKEEPALCDEAEVSITIAAVNDAPVANDDAETVEEDTPEDIDVLLNDTDPDGKADINPATLRVVDEPSLGTATTTADGKIRYAPGENNNGNDSFTYEVCDRDGLCDRATVAVSITSANDAPVAVDDAATLKEDTTTTVNVLANDVDPEGNLDPSTVRVLTGTRNGTATANPDGTVTYKPNANFNGSDSFTYEVCDTDGDCSNAATVKMTVTPVDEAKPRCTIRGNDRDNNIKGTAKRDVICGRGGNDTIRGMGSNDLIFGNAGNDTIQGNGGDDTIYGGGGEDNIQGNDGNDRIYGGEKGDLLQGNDGRDTIRGGGGDDTIQGGAGDDDIDGGVGNDTTQQ